MPRILRPCLRTLPRALRSPTVGLAETTALCAVHWVSDGHFGFSLLCFVRCFIFLLFLPTEEADVGCFPQKQLMLVLLVLYTCLYTFDQSILILCFMGIAGHLVWLYVIISGLDFCYVALLSVRAWDSQRSKNCHHHCRHQLPDSTGTSP